MKMTRTSDLNPHPLEFERFLYAPVGEDRRGYVVTVLSTLARLGLDPWSETAELATLGRDAAGTRLGALLSRFGDVPALVSDHGTVARELSLLLPDASPTHSMKRATTTVAPGGAPSRGAVWTLVAIIGAGVQSLFARRPGPDE
jgi:hypothetical protein